MEIKIDWSYQRVGTDFLKSGSTGILDDMGLGKTKQILQACEELEASSVLVVCSSSSKINWEREVYLWTNYEAVVISSGRQSIPEWKKLAEDKPKNVVVITHYENFRDQLEYIEKAFPKSLSNKIVIFDEAHKLKNRSSKVARAACRFRARTQSRVIPATGTPMLRGAEDVYVLLYLIDPPKFRSYHKFIDTYFTVHHIDFGRGYMVRKIAGLKDPESFKAMLDTYFIRRTKKEVMNIPEIYIPKTVDLEGQQFINYQTMLRMNYAEIKEGIEIGAVDSLSQLTRLKQIAVSHDLLDPDTDSLGGAKIKCLLDILEEISDEKVVIFSQFRTFVERFYKLATKKGFGGSLIHGGVPIEERQGIIDVFQDDPKQKFLVCGYQVAGESLNMNRSTAVVLVDKLWVPGLNRQAIDRLVRGGQEGVVTIIDLIANNTIEGYINRKLGKREIEINEALPIRTLLEALENSEI